MRISHLRETPYWLDTLPASEQFRTHRELPPRVDVVVIGAGLTGLSAARRLARSGASVLVVERVGIGAGASGRNGGQVLTGLRIDAPTLVARFGERQARVLFDASLDAMTFLEQLIVEASIDCEYERTGHIHAAWKPAHFELFRAEQALLARAFQHRVELVSRADQRQEIGSDRYHGLLVDERSGAINPAKYVNGLAASATRAGARIVTGVAVSGLRRTGSEWSVETTGGSIQTRDVLAATNGYSGPATPLLYRRIVSIGSYVVASEPLSESTCRELLPKGRMAYDSKNFLYYFRLTSDRRLLFGGRASFSQADEQTTRKAAAILRRGMVDVFPQLGSAAIDYAWGGQVAIARDERPHAGRFGDGMYFAAGYAGHGIAMSTLLGDLTARRIAGESVRHPFMDDDCPPIPLYGGRPWFLPLVGAYYQVLDWIS